MPRGLTYPIHPSSIQPISLSAQNFLLSTYYVSGAVRDTGVRQCTKQTKAPYVLGEKTDYARVNVIT